jgi:phage gp46-like protein
MPDIAVRFDPANYRGDFALAGGDIAAGDDLQSLVIVSLFSDRAQWWGDAYADVLLGSNLYLLRRAKRTTETLLRARDYAQEALAWLITDSIARTVVVEPSWQARWLALRITITRADSSVVQFAWAWDALGIGAN